MRAAIYTRVSSESGRTVAAMLVFSACGSISGPGAWKVEDRERQRFATDRFECLGELPQAERAGVSTQAHFVACMEARGWERR
jgi:hypothetical protein